MYELSEDVKMLQELAMDFTRREIMPRAEYYDQNDEWPWEIFQKGARGWACQSQYSGGVRRHGRNRIGRVRDRRVDGLRLLRHPNCT